MDQDRRHDDVAPAAGPDAGSESSLAPAADGGSGTAPPGGGPDRPRGRGRWVLAALAALGVALFAVPFGQGPRDRGGSAAPGPAAQSGSSCPAGNGTANFDVTLKDMHGQDVRLADYKGKVVLFNFWATWCGPCRVEIPELVRLVEENRSKGFEVLGVSIDDTPEQLRAFAEETGMNYPSLLMTPELEASFGEMWALPTSFIVDRKGSICLKHMGPVTEEMVEREITGLL
jgi:peroxiredoxin